MNSKNPVGLASGIFYCLFLFFLGKEPVTDGVDAIGERPGVHVVAVGEDRVIDLLALCGKIAYLLIEVSHRRLAVPPRRSVARDGTAERLPERRGLIHAGESLVVARADRDPERLVLHRSHFLHIPLAGDEPLRGKKIRIAVADGDIRHAAL